MPTRMKLVKGERRPSRVNYNEPEPSADAISPTESLDEQERAIWNARVAELADAGVLANTDCVQLTRYCQTLALYQNALAKVKQSDQVIAGYRGSPVTNPYARRCDVLNKQLTAMEAEFGMTPSSRTRVSVESKKKPKGFDID